jgi:hypothetical protein
MALYPTSMALQLIMVAVVVVAQFQIQLPFQAEQVA